MKIFLSPFSQMCWGGNCMIFFPFFRPQLIGIQEFLFPFLGTREVLDSMTKVGEIQARLKQMEVALDAAELEKREAENEAVLAKEKAESSKSEIKRIELKVSIFCVCCFRN